jgi:hypothetical protein
MENPTTSNTCTYSTKGFTASCLNHLTHGATARSLFIKDEKPEDYVALLEETFAQYKPSSNHDAGIVARCCHDQWILLRRERAADNVEAALYIRQPDSVGWTSEDLAEMTLFARYKTEAARAYDRSLHCLKTLKKLHRDDDRWQSHLDTQKKKLAIHIERFELSKQRKQQQQQTVAVSSEEPPVEAPPLAEPPPPPPAPNAVGQTLFIGVENGQTVVYDTRPSNADLRLLVKEDTTISRTYNFVGSVPSEYRHLVTGEAYTFGKSTCVHKAYTFQEWSKLAE